MKNLFLIVLAGIAAVILLHTIVGPIWPSPKAEASEGVIEDDAYICSHLHQYGSNQAYVDYCVDLMERGL